ncbi:glycosyltransferase family 1 protein [Zalerion maritima]|uniref:sterol 3beta-glucosyltransferase n=1 Tax=Zalerion maritima TaxID=339359 RepID=A0AAD5WNY7_9PEZI|nr:glycosyltransferase family 1 protein [Zalerion maritima]
MGTHEDDENRRRSARKLQKKRQGGHVPSVELPANLRETDDAADEDITAPKGPNNMFTNMNQSLFGIMVAAGSSMDFDRGQSSDDSDDEGDHRQDRQHANKASSTPGLPGLSQTTVLPRRNQRQPTDDRRGKRRLSAKNMFKSFSALSPRTRQRSKLSEGSSTFETFATQPTTSEGEWESQGDDQEDQAVASPTINVTYPETTIAPVMSRMLDARDEMASRPSFDLERLSEETLRKDDDIDDEDLKPSRLARQLKEIFGLEKCEDVIAEFPAWFLKNVMLQGYMYVTQQHICFYSYLPKKNHEIAKAGYLSKTGKHNPKYSRFWFRLKGDVLAYYPDSSNHYFPHGQVDLRYAVAAKITDKEKEGVHFILETTYRTYYFKADSPQSAKEWVKSLQRVVFRSHNDGDSIKILLPFNNVIDVEECPMMDFAETCKIRVIDNDETYSIDEYFFSFFGPSTEEAFTILKILAEDSSAQNTDSDKLGVMTSAREISGESSKRASMSDARDSGERKRKVKESVKATLMSPISHSAANSPRGSMDLSRASTDGAGNIRRSFDSRGRRSASETRKPLSKSKRERAPTVDKSKSSDSYVQSMEDPSIISGMAASSSDEPSASQILKDSDVFHSPTIRRSGSESRKETTSKRGETSRHKSATKFAVSSNNGQQEVMSPSTALPPGAFPLQRASYWTSILNKSTKRMSDLLATQSMGYVEKVSGMWKGGHRHYNQASGLRVDTSMEDDPIETELSNERFRQHFALPDTETLVATYFASLFRVLPLYGKIYISNNSFCFRSLLPGTRTKLILPLKDIETAEKEKGFRLGYSGLCLVIKGHEELFFEFNQADVRDDCVVTMLQALEKLRYLSESGQLGVDEKEKAHAAIAERDALHQASQDAFPGRELPRHPSALSEPTILFDDPKASFLNFKPKESLRITCLTIGSRGDVQPYIAFCKGLLAEGHRPKIATHAEFKDWVEKHGIEFAPIDGDPGELMRICIEHGTFTLSFLKEANSKFRGWLDDLLLSAWRACQGSDVLVESPSAMAGIHIAEKLAIPYFRAFTMPWTRTRAYPHAFIVPENRLGGGYNYFTYVMFDNVFWKASAGQVNRWRNRTLGLPSTNLEKMQPNKVPFLYNFSPAVVPPPLDYSDWIRVTGYWFLDEGKHFQPPRDLVNFINKARADGKKLVYVGFGSIIVADPAKMTQEVIDAVKKADVRCVLSKGWSDRMSGNQDDTHLPPEIFQIKAAPHDWLFAQMDAAAHHGGSGTTGASLRAGIPTIIRPFFGDQYFFGYRVEDLGVGIRLSKWGAVSFARALWEATHSQRMIDRARVLGERIRSENGVETGIQLLYRDMEYARSLIMAKSGKNGQTSSEEEEGAEEEESWTFVGPEGSEDAAMDLSASVILGKATNEPSSLGSQVLKSGSQ